MRRFLGESERRGEIRRPCPIDKPLRVRSDCDTIVVASLSAAPIVPSEFHDCRTLGLRKLRQTVRQFRRHLGVGERL